MTDPIPISALQHFIYCPRQCALIHVERSYSENVYTMRGNRVHERAHHASVEMLQGVRIERAVPLTSVSLGLSGVADVVEFLADGTPYPVEYKAGARKSRLADDVQLGAQAMCLEEMLGVWVPEGSIYYDRSRRRRKVKIDDALRSSVKRTVLEVRNILEHVGLPKPVDDDRCNSCSLIDTCMPAEVCAWHSHRIDPFEILEVT